MFYNKAPVLEIIITLLLAPEQAWVGLTLPYKVVQSNAPDHTDFTVQHSTHPRPAVIEGEVLGSFPAGDRRLSPPLSRD